MKVVVQASALLTQVVTQKMKANTVPRKKEKFLKKMWNRPKSSKMIKNQKAILTRNMDTTTTKKMMAIKICKTFQIKKLKSINFVTLKLKFKKGNFKSQKKNLLNN